MPYQKRTRRTVRIANFILGAENMSVESVFLQVFSGQTEAVRRTHRDLPGKLERRPDMGARQETIRTQSAIWCCI